MLPGARIASLLGAPFPVMVIQRLREISEGEQVVGLPDLGDPVLETIRKSAVELIVQRGRALVDLCSEATELGDVFDYLLVVRHSEVLEVMFRGPRSVVRSEVDTEFLLERGVVGHEHRRVVGHPF